MMTPLMQKSGPCVVRESRFQTTIPALFQVDDFSRPLRWTGAGAGTVLNLSSRGCLLKTDARLPAGKDLILHLYHDTHHVRIRIEHGAIRWSRDNHFGIEFVTVEQAERSHLQHVLNELACEAGMDTALQ